MRVTKSFFFSFLHFSFFFWLSSLGTDSEMLFWSRCVRLCSAQPHAGRLSGSSPDVLECAEVQHLFFLSHFLKIVFYFYFIRAAAQSETPPKRAHKFIPRACTCRWATWMAHFYASSPATPPPTTTPVMYEEETKYPAADQTPAALPPSSSRSSPHLLLFVLPASCVSLWR